MSILSYESSHRIIASFDLNQYYGQTIHVRKIHNRSGSDPVKIQYEYTYSLLHYDGLVDLDVNLLHIN